MILVVQSPAEEGCGNDELVNCLLSADYCPPEEYMSFEFGPKSALNYPKRCADICIRHKAVSRALAEKDTVRKGISPEAEWSNFSFVAPSSEEL